ncbi:MAG: YebC/PmpR family DNA-binding transcriptional regulator [Nitrospirae bacterium]|nr:YebC/PmpR family DNA-binding transcriptional regulator [Nitrospirota bacterium]
MSGHSKWATTKHKKAAADAKRGKIFTKLTKELTTAARLGGGDASGNPRLRLALDKARAVNMPADNIKRAIQKGTGELPGVSYEEISYEGYGPGGVALLIDTLTDNKVRTVAEIRHLLSKNGGNMGESGCVSWMFEQKGYILVGKDKTDEDTLMTVALDAGAEDMKNSEGEDNFEVTTDPSNLDAVRAAIEKAGIAIESAEITKLPQNEVTITEEAVAAQMLRLMEAIEDNDDVNEVYANFDIPDDLMAKISGD